jgi:hypothetical protein
MSNICPCCSSPFSQDIGFVINDSNGTQVSIGLCATCYSWVPLNYEYRKITDELENQTKYHENEWSTSEPDEYKKAAEGIKGVIGENSMYFGEPGDRLICDVGAGRANFLMALIDMGYQAIGCEPSSVLADKARLIYELNDTQLLNYDAAGMSNYLNINNISVGVFVLWHVIEHIPQTIALLEKLISNGDGEITLVFQTPLPVKKYLYEEHLFFPTIETYYYIAEFFNFEIKFLKTVPYTRYVTCIMSNSPTKQKHVEPKRDISSARDAVGLHAERLSKCVEELVGVIDNQKRKISKLNKIT